jgi:hypothetical protein
MTVKDVLREWVSRNEEDRDKMKKSKLQKNRRAE